MDRTSPANAPENAALYMAHCGCLMTLGHFPVLAKPYYIDTDGERHEAP